MGFSILLAPHIIYFLVCTLWQRGKPHPRCRGLAYRGRPPSQTRQAASDADFRKERNNGLVRPVQGDCASQLRGTTTLQFQHRPSSEAPNRRIEPSNLKVQLRRPLSQTCRMKQQHVPTRQTPRENTAGVDRYVVAVRERPLGYACVNIIRNLFLF